MKIIEYQTKKLLRVALLCLIFTINLNFINAQLSINFESIPPSCAGTNNGMIISTVDGGNEPYTYIWSNGNNESTINNLTAGTYTLTVTDASGQSAVNTTAISQPASIQLFISLLGICDNKNIIANASGGNGSLTYSWNNGITTPENNNLEIGNYTVTVTDANGCTAITSYNLESFNTGSTIGDYVWYDSNLNGIQDSTETGFGNIQVFLQNANGGFLSALTNANGQYAFQNLNSGNYKLTFVGVPNGYLFSNQNAGNDDEKDSDVNTTNSSISNILVNSNQCITNLDAGIITDTCTNVSNPGTITGNETLCSGSSDANLITELTPATGGIQPYEYVWMYTTDYIGAPPAGLWTIIPGANGPTYDPGVLTQTTWFVRCVKSATCNDFLESNIIVKYVTNFNVNVVSTNTLCTTSSGTATVTAIGDNPPFSYLWNDGNTEPIRNNLAAGTYYVTTTDTIGCSAIDTIIIQSENGNLAVEIDINQHPLGGCNPSNNGSITATASEVVSYLWNTGSNAQNITGLAPGNYTVTVTNADGCQATSMVQLTTISSGGAIGNYVWVDENHNGIQNNNEPGLANIQVVLSQSNGFSLVTYTDETGYYNFYNLAAGTYKLTFLNLPDDYLFTVQNGGSNDNNDSDVNPNNGMISNIILSENDCIDNLDAGVYTNPCQNVTNPGTIQGNETLCGTGVDAANISEVTPASGGSGTVEYLWMFTTNYQGPPPAGVWQIVPGATGASYDPGILYQTTWFVRCTKSSTCTDYIETNIIKKTVGNTAVALIEGPSQICVNFPVNFDAAPSSPGATYHWQFGSSSFVVSPPSATTQAVNDVQFHLFGAFPVKLTVQNQGCTATQTITYYVSDDPSNCNSTMNIVSFNTEMEGNNLVYLNWVAQNEIAGNDIKYIVERSKDAENFEPINVLTCTNIVGQYNLYEFKDYDPLMGKSFYRVRQVINGVTIDISEVKQIMNATSDETVMVYPNPFSNQLFIELLENYQTNLDISIINIDGKVIRQKVFDKNITRPSFDTENLTAGIYFIKLIYDNDKIKVVKIMKN